MTIVSLEIRLLLFQSFAPGHEGELSNVQAIQLQKNQAHKGIRHALFADSFIIKSSFAAIFYFWQKTKGFIENPFFNKERKKISFLFLVSFFGEFSLPDS